MMIIVWLEHNFFAITIVGIYRMMVDKVVLEIEAQPKLHKLLVVITSRKFPVYLQVVLKE